jgi:hypothetical protein
MSGDGQADDRSEVYDELQTLELAEVNFLFVAEELSVIHVFI